MGSEDVYAMTDAEQHPVRFSRRQNDEFHVFLPHNRSEIFSVTYLVNILFGGFWGIDQNQAGSHAALPRSQSNGPL